MMGPVSDQWSFQPLYPQWLWEACITRWDQYRDGYVDLAVQNFGDVSTLISFPNISIEQANEYAVSAGLSVGEISGVPLDSLDSDGNPVLLERWPISQGQPLPGSELSYYRSMCGGIVAWQMYAVLLSEQIVRFAHFKHYGRPNKEDTQ